jgi:tight adherence protein C
MEKLMALFFGLAVFFLVRGILPKAEVVAFRSRLDKDQEASFSEGGAFINRLRPLYGLFLPLVKPLPLESYRSMIEKKTITAGMEHEFDGNDFMAFQILMAIMFLGILHLMFKNWPLSLVGLLIGLLMSYVWITDRMKTRQEEIKRSMPDIVDTLALAVEAGLDFNAAIEKTCSIYFDAKSPFTVELQLMLKNLQLGRSRPEALKLMSDRVQTIEMATFTSVLIQADRMGSSMSDTLKEQAVTLRRERFMQAERAGAIAAQKLMIPLVLFIFPVIFLIVLSPFILQFIYQ